MSHADRQPPSGEQIELSFGDQRLTVVSGGAGIRRYALKGVDLLDGYAELEPCTGGRGQLLIPWPNRIRDGRYQFAGEAHQLALTEPTRANAIHGFTSAHTWQVSVRADHRVTLNHQMVAQFGYPWTLALEVEYALGAEGLSVRLSATNTSGEPAPYGSGAHPYLRTGNGLVDGCTLRIPAATRLTTDERQIPTGEVAVEGTEWDYRQPRPISTMRMDTTFSDLIRDADGCARVELRDSETGIGLSLWMDNAYEFLMIFTGDTLGDRARHGLAVEPMTCPPNAFASGDHLAALHPGETHVSEWGITPVGPARS